MTTLFAGSLSSGARVTDFAVHATAGGTCLIAAAQPGAGMLSFRATAGQPAALVDTVAYPAGADLLGPTRLDLLPTAEGTLVLPAGRFPAEITGTLISADGSFGALRGLSDGTGPGGAATTLEIVPVTAGFALFGAVPSFTGIAAWSLGPSGTGPLAPLGGYADTGETYADRPVALTAWADAGGQWLLAASASENGVSLFHVQADGSLAPVGGIGASDGLGIAAPVAMEVVALGESTFAVVASSGSSALSVLRVTPQGLVPTDHVTDDMSTRFQSVSALTALTAGDRAYVAAGGADDGISLFQLLPDGRLILIETVEDSAGMSLADVSALKLLSAGGELQLYVASGSENGVTQFRIDPGDPGLTIQGTGAAEALGGGAADDVLLGGGGDDALSGGAGTDILVDGTGRDTLTGGAGADFFILLADGQQDRVADFDPSSDRLDLSDWPLLYDPSQLSVTPTATGAVLTYRDEVLVVDSASGALLAAGDFTRANTLNLARSPVQLILAGRTESGTAGPDALRGTIFGDRLSGLAGADTLTGMDGDDTLTGGAGADLLDGGAGQDTASYADAAAGVSADLAGGAGSGDAAGDAFAGIENLEGSGFADTLSGDAAANRLSGGAGADLLRGRGGSDVLQGGEGDDTLDGGTGADTLDGGAGRDLADYSAAPSAVVADLSGLAAGSGDAAGDLCIGIEDLRGSAYADRLAGDAEANRLSGLAGDDTLEGGAGDDTLSGGAGADRLDGGGGFDTASYADAAAGVLADMLNPARGTGFAAGDVLAGIEAIEGTAWGDDLRGDALGNLLAGGGGVDWLMGRAGNDTLFGGEGNDNLIGGPGADLLDGGAGFDRALYTDATAGVLADLADPSRNTGAAAGDSFISIEGLRGSNFDDALWGDGQASGIDGGSGNDSIYGRGGNDSLVGRAGADLIDGGDGNDVIYGGAGADTLIGGTGTDRANYGDSATGLVADLLDPGANTGYAAGDVFIGIENLQGSIGHDTLAGDDGDNMVNGAKGNDMLSGRGGADYLIGGDGDDWLWGGAGNDSLHGGAGADVFVLRPGDASDRVLDFQTGTDRLLLSPEFGIGGMSAADILAGYATDTGADVWLDFGADSFLIRNVADPGALLGDIVIG